MAMHGVLTAAPTTRSPSPPEAGSATSPPDADVAGRWLGLFAVSWALASLFHLVGNSPVSFGRMAAQGGLSAVDWGHVALGASALAVLRRPSDLRRLDALAAVGLVTVALETPVLSNHWLVAGFVDLAWLLAAGLVRRRREGSDPAARWRLFAPTARLVLLLFYLFAAFAKLNRDFLDPDVSCATFFFDESTGSLGLGGLGLGSSALLDRGVVIASLIVELAVPVLLAMRRSRHAGVVLGLSFHFVLALDQAHQFFDFSAVLFALFLLFMPDDWARWVGTAVERWPRWRHLAAGVGATALLAIALGREHGGLGEVFIVVRHLAWLGVATVTLVAVVAWLRRSRPEPVRRPFRPAHAALAVVPMLVVLNGLTPYLEMKSAFGFTMYSNVRLVSGESNHLLVRRSLPLNDTQRDPVTIVDSSDPKLAGYRDGRYAITWSQFRAYAADRPEVAVHYVRRGVHHRLARLADDPGLVAPLPWWQRRLWVFRAIDQTDDERCLPVWGVAR